MKRFIAILATTAVLAVPAHAADDEEMSDGLSLIDQGARLFFRGLMNEMEPAISDLQALGDEFGPKMAELVNEMGPALSDMLDRIDDIRNYEAPEVLPNGDIIIRRRPDATPWEPREDDIEL